MSLSKLKEFLLDLVFPRLCLGCGDYLSRGQDWLCDKCSSSIKISNSFFCPECLARLPDFQKTCHQSNRYILAAAGNYENQALRNLIHFFKYRRFLGLAPFLAQILSDYLEKVLNPGELKEFLFVPIPLHWLREKKRGFNQSRILAEITASLFGSKALDCLERTIDNKPQASLQEKEDRKRNMAGCFRIKNPEAVRGKNFIIVDDVFTSGATMDEAAKILKAAGAKKIMALVLAKA